MVICAVGRAYSWGNKSGTGPGPILKGNFIRTWKGIGGFRQRSARSNEIRDKQLMWDPTNGGGFGSEKLLAQVGEGLSVSGQVIW